MKIWVQKKSVFFAYGFCLILAVAIIIARQFEFIPLSSLLLLSFLFIPGFALSRLLKVKTENLTDKLAFWLILGLIFNFVLMFLAISAGFTMSLLLIIYPALIFLLWLAAFIIDILSPAKEESPMIKLTDIFNWNRLPVFLGAIFLIVLLVVIGRQGSLFKGGDAMYHLSILRKAFDGEPLTIHNLSYAKSQILVAYGFPVWHVLLALWAKLMGTDIFSIWKESVLMLSMMAFFTWYWLARQIFANKNIALLSLLFFAVFTFNFDAGYALLTLPIPHSLMQFLLLPLSVGLALFYIFKKGHDHKLLAILAVFVILMGVIHLTGYFSYLTIIIALALFYLIFRFRDQDFKEKMFKIGLSVLSSLAILAPFAVFLEIKSKSISETFKTFSDEDYPKDLSSNSFGVFTTLTQYAYLVLPLMMIFIKKYRRLIIILAIFLVVPLIYFTPLRVWLVGILGYIFIKRLDGNVLWYFLVWALILDFGLMILDRAVLKISAVSGFMRIMVNTFFVLLAVGLVWAQIKFGLADTIYNYIFSPAAAGWVERNYFSVILMSLFIALVIWLVQRRAKEAEDFCLLSEPRSVLINCISIFIIAFILISPSFPTFASYAKTKTFQHFAKPSKASAENYAYNYVGGKETIDFIKQNIPPKAVFDARGGFFYLPMLADVHMSTYHSQADTANSYLYESKFSLAKKMSLIDRDKLEYLLLVRPKLESLANIQKYPEYFIKIYEENSVYIYKIDTCKVQQAVAKNQFCI